MITKAEVQSETVRRRVAKAAYYQANKDSLKEGMRQWYQENKDLKLRGDKVSAKERMRQWYEKNKGYCKRKRAEYYQTHKDQIKAKTREYFHQNKDRAIEQKLKHNYGITKTDYEKLLVSQGGKCAGCGVLQGTKSKRLYVDHCHRTGKIRGLLCAKCNFVLGHANDDEQILLRLAEYLRRQQG
jgi:hypothetical protein